MNNLYLKSENATVTIEYDEKNFSKFISNNYDFIEKSGIVFLYVECDVILLENLYRDLIDYKFVNCNIFLKVLNYSEKFNYILDEIAERYYIIISTNVNEIDSFKLRDDCYYEINFEYFEHEKIIEVINKFENIILNINYDLNHLEKVNNALENIMINSTANEISFVNLFIDKELIYSSPYNIYLNNENSNRSYGNLLPRNIYISQSGNVFCMYSDNDKFIIGNIIDEKLYNILNDCKQKHGYKNFIYYNERLFYKYLNQCPFSTIDYVAYLNEVAND